MTEKSKKAEDNEPKMSTSEAQQAFVKFLSIFPMVQELREALDVAMNLEGEAARLKKEKKEAEEEARAAIEARDKAKAALETTNLRLAEAIEKSKKDLKNEADGLVRFKDQCAKETERIRAENLDERKRIMDVTQALEHKRGNLAREVRQMERQPGDPEKGAQARLSHE